MRDSKIINLIEDYNRFKKFFKKYVETEGMHNFEAQVRMKAIERVLNRIPGIGGLIKRETRRIIEKGLRDEDRGS